jgi:hypothetical protein
LFSPYKEATVGFLDLRAIVCFFRAMTAFLANDNERECLAPDTAYHPS